MLEFLSTPDLLRRERLIRLAQEICSPVLLPEVERLLAHFIARESAIPQLAPLILSDDDPTTGIRAAWAETKADPERTLVVNDDLLSRFRSFRALFDTIHAHIRRGDSIEDTLESMPWTPSSKTVSIETALKAVGTERRRRTPAPDASQLVIQEQRCRCRTPALVLICSGLTPFEQPIDQLWQALGVPREGRLPFAFRHLSFLFEHGPLVGMGLALAAQWLRKSESGNVFDLYHVAYLPLCQMFFTNDVRTPPDRRMDSRSRNRSSE